MEAFYQNEDGSWKDDACIDAVTNNDLNGLKYLHKNGCPWDEVVIYSKACSLGNYEILKYLNENGYSWDSYACGEVSTNGYLDCLKKLHENGCPWTEEACTGAVNGGHFGCLEYLHENGCPWTEEACEFASKHGDIDILIYLHENGCPWDKRACREAARNGHLDCLKYLHENGCLWNEWVCYDAQTNNHIDCLKYLLEHDCPIYTITYNECKSILNTHTWFQVYMYVKKGILNENTLHIYHKVLRIQRAWHRYAYNPESKIGQERMLKSMSENNDELESIM